MSGVGDLVVTNTDDGPVITHADPVIGISDEMMVDIMFGKCAPWATFEALDGPHNMVTFADKAGRRYVYRVSPDYDVLRRCWLAEWPD